VPSHVILRSRICDMETRLSVEGIIREVQAEIGRLERSTTFRNIRYRFQLECHIAVEHKATIFRFD
jgi:hypothetical protein